MRERTMERIRQYVNQQIHQAVDIHLDQRHAGVPAPIREYFLARIQEHLDAFDHQRSILMPTPPQKPDRPVGRTYREVQCPYCPLHFRVYITSEAGRVVLEADRIVTYSRAQHMKEVHPHTLAPKKACECCGHIEGT